MDNISPNNLPGSQHKNDTELLDRCIPDDEEEDKNETQFAEKITDMES